MNALVLGLVVAAAGSTDVDGAVSIAGKLVRQPQAGTTSVEAHVRVDLARDFGRFFIDGRASVLASDAPLGLGFSDLGTRLRVGYRPTGVVEHVSLEVLPFNPALRLVSFDWANAWGLPLKTVALAPVLTAELATKPLRVSFSARFKSQLNPLTQLQELTPDFFAGADAALAHDLRFELRGGVLSNGLEGSRGALGVSLPLTVAGVGARLSWSWQEVVAPAVDLTTYASDPTRFERLFVAEPRRAPFAATLALEGGGASQQLADPATFAGKKAQLMGWADLQARLRLHELRLFGTLRVHSMTHTVFDVPSVVPGTALFDEFTTAPAVTGYLGADVTLPALRLTPGILLRATSPAWVGQTLTGDIPGVEKGTRYRYWLPSGITGVVAPGKQVAPLLGAKASARWDVVAFLSVVTEVDVEVDLNELPVIPGFEVDPDRVTVRGQLLMQARF